MEKVRTAAAIYFILQGLGVIAWWLLLLLVPDSRRLFVFEENRETSLLAFWLADLIFIAAGSIITAVLILRRSKFAVPSVWMVTGAVGYASLYTLAFVLVSDHGWLGVVLMMPAMLWSGVFATALTVGGEMFRAARSTSTNYILIKTFSQIAIVWALILVVIPFVITLIETKLGIPRLEFAFQRPLAAVIFVAFSSIGVWAAIVMSRVGKGTPLPLDHATELVVVGPYKFVRNPMAVSGIGQGLAVALFFGSPLVALYALTGSLIWQLIFRPLEEDDMEQRFGSSFLEYKSSVRCWVPRTLRPGGGKPTFLTETYRIDSAAETDQLNN